MNITLFCSSSDKLSPVFYSEAKLVGEMVGKKNHHLYFGGSAMGLMKAVSEATLSQGGQVTGVTTKSLNEEFDVCEGLHKLLVCEDLRERKGKLIEVADVILVLPGGIGTLDEMFDVLAARQVGESNKRVLLYNCYDFWSGLVAYLEQLREQKMISQNLSDFYIVVDSIEGLDKELQSAERFLK